MADNLQNGTNAPELSEILQQRRDKLAALKEAGQNPFILDSKAPTKPFRDFINNEVRYSALALEYPEEAEAMFAKCEADAKERLESYQRLAEQKAE